MLIKINKLFCQQQQIIIEYVTSKNENNSCSNAARTRILLIWILSSEQSERVVFLKILMPYVFQFTNTD